MTGVDISLPLLEIARQREANEPLGIQFLHGDAHSLTWWDGDPFDGAVCDMALMDFDDLRAAVRTLATVMRDGAWLVLALFHPCYPGADGGPASWPAEGGYFAEGRWLPPNATGVRGAVGANHRTLSAYLNALLEVGFRFDTAAEPRIGTVPTILLIRAHLSRSDSDHRDVAG